MPTELIDVKTIASTLGVTPRVVNERIKSLPDFPRPALAINHKTTRWDRSQVEDWIKKRAKAQAR
jgi:predicted DNA-binding transcriptional regulator AlpA